MILFIRTLGYDSECGTLSSSVELLEEFPVFKLFIIFEISSIVITNFSLFKWNSASRLAGFIIKSRSSKQGGALLNEPNFHINPSASEIWPILELVIK